jgi:hypothetical protein
MSRGPISRRSGIIALAGLVAFAAPGAATPRPTQAPPMQEAVATGSFDVEMKPTSPPDAAVGATSIAKTFHGGLEGHSTGTMLAVGTAVAGSAGYVAMERVTGTLGGRKGTFALQHSGTMDKGTPSLSVTVVPDSGTEGLAGLTGRLDIRIEGGTHFYVFRYALPPPGRP